MTAADISGFDLRLATGLAQIEARAWDACAQGQNGQTPQIAATGHAEAPRRSRNPFLSHAFLSALEEAGCVGGRTGWSPAHLLVQDGAGALQACAPCYLKSHSQGEYVFDYGWADAYQRAGGHYYPKVQVSVPFTPVTGPRLLVRDGEGQERAREALIAGLKALCAETEASSVHLTFLPEADWTDLGQRGFLQRTDQQFHWLNENYRDYEDFLEALASRKRKNLRKERRDAFANGITVEWLTGKDLREEHWDAFFTFYMDTGSRKWGRPYLNRLFFSLIGERMVDEVLLVMAKRAGRYIAGAINFIGSDTLFGRNWGCVEDHPFLHFEICYHQAIDFAIAHGLAKVEAGAQGEHKLARGYRPVTTYSAHWIADPALRRAVSDYLARERLHVAAAIEDYAEHAPFKKG
jgi:predicted N-acyltransferase